MTTGEVPVFSHLSTHRSSDSNLKHPTISMLLTIKLSNHASYVDINEIVFQIICVTQAKKHHSKHFLLLWKTKDQQS